MFGYNEQDILIRKNVLDEDSHGIDHKKGIVVRGLLELYVPLSKDVSTI